MTGREGESECGLMRSCLFLSSLFCNTHTYALTNAVSVLPGELIESGRLGDGDFVTAVPCLGTYISGMSNTDEPLTFITNSTGGRGLICCRCRAAGLTVLRGGMTTGVRGVVGCD